jgi:hypothetical protein
LQAQEIPFVFMTGYGADTIGAPFPEVRIFQKPLEREMLRELFVANVAESTHVKAAAFAQRSGHTGSRG